MDITVLPFLICLTKLYSKYRFTVPLNASLNLKRGLGQAGEHSGAGGHQQVSEGEQGIPRQVLPH